MNPTPLPSHLLFTLPSFFKKNLCTLNYKPPRGYNGTMERWFYYFSWFIFPFYLFWKFHSCFIYTTSDFSLYHNFVYCIFQLHVKWMCSLNFSLTVRLLTKTDFFLFVFVWITFICAERYHQSFKHVLKPA